MTDKTLSIIAICKGNTRYNENNTVSVSTSLKQYLSDTTKTIIEYYNERRLESILRDAFYDFLDSCDKPSIYLRCLDRNMSEPWNMSYANAVASTLAIIEVVENDKYVNGFNSRFDQIIHDLS